MKLKTYFKNNNMHRKLFMQNNSEKTKNQSSREKKKDF